MLRAVLALLVSILTIASVRAEPSAQPSNPNLAFRELESVTSSPFRIIWIGTDESVNHCILAQDTNLSAPKPETPIYFLLVDNQAAILRVRSASFHFAEKGKALSVTIKTPDGRERKPPSATGGPDMADILLGAHVNFDALAAYSYLDIQAADATTHLSLDGMTKALPALKECMGDIGRPAKDWSDQKIDQLIRHNPQCTEDSRHRIVCDVEPIR